MTDSKQRAQAVKELRRAWSALRPEIEDRLAGFRRIWEKGSERQVFAELVFCLFTPQSKAQNCWSCVENIFDRDLLARGDREPLHAALNKVRFKYNKTRYALLAAAQFSGGKTIKIKARLRSFPGDRGRREWLVDNVTGLGYKEATHFLRNIGFAGDLAILDRHILRKLVEFGVIREIPSLSKKNYLALEDRMRAFSREVRIPMSHLDLVFWHQATGCIFK